MTRVRERVAGVPARGDDTAAAQFAADVQYYLMQNPRQLPAGLRRRPRRAGKPL